MAKAPKRKPRMVKFSVYVESDVFDRLLIAARKEKRPLSQWVAYKLENYVNLFEPREEQADGCTTGVNQTT